MPTKIQIKQQIDTDITVKTNPNTISPIMVGNNMKAVVDKIPPVFSVDDVGENKLVKSQVTDSANETTVLTLRGIKSNNLNVQISSDGNDIEIDLPSSFQGIDYYVNNNYTGTEELGTSSKPFKTLINCIDKILNRGAFQDPTINGGNAYNKWDLRPGVSSGAIRVIIQSYTEISENLAINNVEYFLERGGYDSHISVPVAATLEYLIDMKELVDNVPLVAGKLPYHLTTSITGKGTISFQFGNNSRKGYFRAYGHNDGTVIEQNDSTLNIGSVGGDINCIMYKRTNLTYNTLYSDAANTIPIVREQTIMTGYQTTAVPDYGAIQVEGANAQFRESCQLSGQLQVNCFEQHLLYCKDFGTVYGDNGRIYIRRNYQHVNYSTIQNIDVNPANPNVLKFYKPSTHIYDVYLKNGGGISYAGDFYTQENTGMNQGGSEAFVCLENTTTDTGKMCSFSANGGGKLVSLLYNHYIKSILNPVFTNYQQHQTAFKGMKFQSSVFEEVISCVNTSGANWTNVLVIGHFVDCFIGDYLIYGNVRKPFSNMIVNTNMYVSGTIISLERGLFNSSLPVYADNTAATTAGFTIGGIYRDNSGNLKVVI